MVKSIWKTDDSYNYQVISSVVTSLAYNLLRVYSCNSLFYLHKTNLQGKREKRKNIFIRGQNDDLASSWFSMIKNKGSNISESKSQNKFKKHKPHRRCIKPPNQFFPS